MRGCCSALTKGCGWTAVGMQDKGMSKVGHDAITAYKNPTIYRQTALTPHLSVYGDDVGSFTRRRGKVYREVPLCQTSTRVLAPLAKNLAKPMVDGYIDDTLVRTLVALASRAVGSNRQFHLGRGGDLRHGE